MHPWRSVGAALDEDSSELGQGTPWSMWGILRALHWALKPKGSPGQTRWERGVLTPGPDVSRLLTFPDSEESTVETSQLHSQHTPSWGLGNPPPPWEEAWSSVQA